MAVFFAALLVPACTKAEERPVPAECTYEMLVWNVNQKGVSIREHVRHPYRKVTARESDPITGCTVCSEDQKLIAIPPLAPFSVCYKIAPRIQIVVSDLVKKKAPINKVEGYRVILSRGDIDKKGNRTEFSNHSFGTAVDINPEQNGLYDNCVQFGPQCRLLRGGVWSPGKAGSLEKEGEIVKGLKAAGFLWGGEIAGKQKDFMHFSLTGY